MKISKFIQFINESNDEYIIQECKLILSEFFDLGTGKLNVIKYLWDSKKSKTNNSYVDITFIDFTHKELRLLLPLLDHLNSFLEDEGYFLSEVPGEYGDDYDDFNWDGVNLFDEVKKALSNDQVLELGLWYEKKPLSEKITIDVEVGDTVYMGRFKNKKTVIKKIDKDETGMPTINGKKVVTFRTQEPKKNPNFKGYRSRFKKKKKD